MSSVSALAPSKQIQQIGASYIGAVRSDLTPLVSRNHLSQHKLYKNRTSSGATSVACGLAVPEKTLMSLCLLAFWLSRLWPSARLLVSVSAILLLLIPQPAWEAIASLYKIQRRQKESGQTSWIWHRLLRFDINTLFATTCKQIAYGLRTPLAR